MLPKGVGDLRDRVDPTELRAERRKCIVGREIPDRSASLLPTTFTSAGDGQHVEEEVIFEAEPRFRAVRSRVISERRVNRARASGDAGGWKPRPARARRCDRSSRCCRRPCQLASQSGDRRRALTDHPCLPQHSDRPPPRGRSRCPASVGHGPARQERQRRPARGRDPLRQRQRRAPAAAGPAR